MLPLDSKKWTELRHAYGDASDIPGLLHQLENMPPRNGQEAEPYFSLWSALCHQGDIYTASYAAVPYLLTAVRKEPARAPWTLLLLVASIEMARIQKHGPAIPIELEKDYFSAIATIPETVAMTASQPWDHWYCVAALATIAAAKGHADCAEAILELVPDKGSSLG